MVGLMSMALPLAVGAWSQPKLPLAVEACPQPKLPKTPSDLPPEFPHQDMRVWTKGTKTRAVDCQYSGSSLDAENCELSGQQNPWKDVQYEPNIARCAYERQDQIAPNFPHSAQCGHFAPVTHDEKYLIDDCAGEVSTDSTGLQSAIAMRSTNCLSLWSVYHCSEDGTRFYRAAYVGPAILQESCPKYWSEKLYNVSSNWWERTLKPDVDLVRLRDFIHADDFHTLMSKADRTAFVNCLATKGTKDEEFMPTGEEETAQCTHQVAHPRVVQQCSATVPTCTVAPFVQGWRSKPSKCSNQDELKRTCIDGCEAGHLPANRSVDPGNCCSDGYEVRKFTKTYYQIRDAPPPTHYLAVVSWFAHHDYDQNARGGSIEACFPRDAVADSSGAGYLFTSCCSADGAGMTRLPCTSTKHTNYDDAVSHCESQGGRLCTAEEAMTGTISGKGCGADGPAKATGGDLNRAWTSTPCRPVPAGPAPVSDEFVV